MKRRWNCLKFEVDDGPGPRHGHAIVPISDGSVVLIGGIAPNIGFLCDSWIMKSPKLHSETSPKWQSAPPSPSTPSPSGRAFFSASSLPGESQIIVIGGKGATGALNDVWLLDISTGLWTQLPKPPPNFIARMGHTISVIGDSVFIFGGLDKEGETLNDSWIFNVKTLVWNEITIPHSNPQPLPRFMHSAITFRGAVFVWGGKSHQNGGVPLASNGVWRFDIALQKWSLINNTINEKYPPGRWAHISVCDEEFGRMIITTGLCSSDKYFDDLWYFDLSSGTWTEEKYSKNEINNRPLGANCAGCCVGRNLIITGGADLSGNSKIVSNSLWISETPLPFISQSSTPILTALMSEGILVNIFSFLNNGSDLARCGAVCKFWKHTTTQHDDLWSQYVMSDPKLRFEQNPALGTYRQTYFAWKTSQRSDLKRIKGMNELIPTVQKRLRNGKPLFLHGLLSPQTFGTYKVKLVIVGDGSVGKTCSLISLLSNSWPEEYIPTIFDMYTAFWQFPEDEITNEVTFVDTSYQEDFDRVFHLNFIDADVIVLMFSMVKRSSFQNIDFIWYKGDSTNFMFAKYCKPNIPVIIVGNKLDLINDERTLRDLAQKHETPVTIKEAQEKAADLNSSFYAISAKTQLNLKSTFDIAIKLGLLFHFANPNISHNSKCSLM